MHDMPSTAVSKKVAAVIEGWMKVVVEGSTGLYTTSLVRWIIVVVAK